jgi:integrase
MAMQLQRVAGELRHDETKTDDSTRMVALPRPCVRALRRHRAQQAADRLAAGDLWTNSGLVFTTRKGTPLEPRNINRTFDALVKRARVKRIRFHDLRHSCATLLFAQGVDLQTIRDLLGHSSIGVTSAIYVDVLREVQRDAVDRLGHLFDPTMRPTPDQQVRSELRSRSDRTWIGPRVLPAPRVGLEPTTLRLTVACSAN